MLLSIITLNYKKPQLTINCLESLYKQFGPEFERDIMEMIIVDNASADGSVNKINNEIKKMKYKNIRVAESKHNLGFSTGCNMGSKIAHGKYLLFLNNDTIAKDRGIIEMASYMNKNSEAAICGGQLRNANGDYQPSCGKFYNLFNTALLLSGMQKYGIIDRSPRSISEVDWVKGALLMVREDVFKTLHGFDEKIFMYTEDMDFCYRAKKLGYRTFFFPTIEILHEDHGSSDRTFAVVQIYKGLIYFYKKHRPYPEYIIVKAMLYTKAWTAIVIGSMTGDKYLKTTFRKAIQF